MNLRTRRITQLVLALIVLGAGVPLSGRSLPPNQGSTTKPVFSLTTFEGREFSLQALPRMEESRVGVRAPTGSANVSITSDADFSAQGFPGSGTPSDPYRIANLTIDVNRTLYSYGIMVYNTTAYFRIENCTIRNATQATFSAGILIYEVNYAQVVNNTVTNCSNGIYLYDSQFSDIFENICTYNDLPHESAGIRLTYAYNTTVARNNCTSNYHGIKLFAAHNSTLTNNLCTLNGAGIELSTTHHYLVASNNCTSNGVGISTEHSEYGIVRNNNCSGNAGTGIDLYSVGYSGDETIARFEDNLCNDNGYTGFWIYDSNGIILSNNTCNTNGHDSIHDGAGIYSYASSYLTFVNNTCNYNEYGILPSWSSIITHNLVAHNTMYGLLVSSTNSLILFNIFENNTLNVFEPWYRTRLNTFDYNYYSDYAGFDADRDGVGDTPYLIPSSSEHLVFVWDYHPLAQPFRSEALEVVVSSHNIREAIVFFLFPVVFTLLVAALTAFYMKRRMISEKESSIFFKFGYLGFVLLLASLLLNRVFFVDLFNFHPVKAVLLGFSLATYSLCSLVFLGLVTAYRSKLGVVAFITTMVAVFSVVITGPFVIVPYIPGGLVFVGIGLLLCYVMLVSWSFPVIRHRARIGHRHTSLIVLVGLFFLLGGLLQIDPVGFAYKISRLQRLLPWYPEFFFEDWFWYLWAPYVWIPFNPLATIFLSIASLLVFAVWVAKLVKSKRGYDK